MSKSFDPGWVRLAWLSLDGKLLLIAKFLRTLAFGYLSVSLSFYLKDMLHFPDVLVGFIFTIAVLGGAVFTIVSSLVANRLGRRTSLSLFALLMLVSGILLATSTDFINIFFAILVGSIGVNATETGPFASIEQAIMPQTTEVQNRTYAFSIYNLLGYAGASIGSLMAALPVVFQIYMHFALIESYRVLFVLYAVTGLVMLVLYKSLSRKTEIQITEIGLSGLSKSKRTVAKLSVLFSMDAFGGGFVIQAVLSSWFKAKYNTSLGAAGTIFFAAQLITAASFLIAGRLAKKIGLLKTMVFTHLPSNLLLVGVALAPTFQSAAVLLFARQTLSQVDVPTRQSYLVAIVEPEERNAATSITNISRNVAAIIPPSISEYLIGAALFVAPFIAGGLCKIAYDVSIYFTFKKIKPPEENKPQKVNKI